MSSAKGRMVRLLGRAVLKSATVTYAEDIGGDFRKLTLQCGPLASAAGTKVQLLLPSNDMRTYTPVPSADGITLLVYKRAGGPGGRWTSDLKVGSEVRFLGPQRSLVLPEGPVILVGDETSVAVAASFEMERPGQVQAIFEANGSQDVRRAAEAVGLRSVCVVSRGETSKIADLVAAAHTASPTSVVALTGGSKLVAEARSFIRARGIEGLKTKTYWIPGRAGLD